MRSAALTDPARGTPPDEVLADVLVLANVIDVGRRTVGELGAPLDARV
jgi:hypothetical protein